MVDSRHLMMSEYDTALHIAEQAHEGQTDKSGKPYIKHPFRVAARFTHPTYKCVALLHDVLEDSSYTPDDLRVAGISDEVVEAVVALTHLKHEQRNDYYERIKKNSLALAVKLADIEDNTDPERLALLDQETRTRLEKKYAEAKRKLLELG